VIGKSDEDLIRDLINIHNAENWLGMDGDSDLMLSPTLAMPMPAVDSSDSQGKFACDGCKEQLYML
jgi:hypothetical protein